MNRIILTGRIVKDLELRCTSSGKDIVNYSLAVRRDKDNTDFINCTTFGETAKTLCEYCNKGDLIGVEGHLQSNQYEDNEGKKHTTFYVLTDKVEFLNTKKKEEKPVVKSVEKTSVELDERFDLPF